MLSKDLEEVLAEPDVPFNTLVSAEREPKLAFDGLPKLGPVLLPIEFGDVMNGEVLSKKDVNLFIPLVCLGCAGCWLWLAALPPMSPVPAVPAVPIKSDK